MNGGSWRYAGASIARTVSHGRDKPCQDAHAIWATGDTLVLAVADGAGSARHGGVGAQLAVTAALAHLTDPTVLEPLGPAELKTTVACARGVLELAAGRYDTPMRDFATTLLVAVIAQTGCYGAQVGDGAIVVCLEGSRDPTLLTRPLHGQYINQTRFLTDTAYGNHLQVATTGPVNAVALFSDGLEPVAVDYVSGTLFTPLFRSLFSWINRHGSLIHLETTLRDLLTGARLAQRCHDDKSLVVAVKQPEVSCAFMSSTKTVG